MTAPVSPETRASVEAVLDTHWPGEWRAARIGEVVPKKLEGRACWRLDASPQDQGHNSVPFVWLGVDGDFPLSRMLVLAPGMATPGALPWPHVEDEGALCLGALPLDIEQHVRFAVSDAFSILSMNEAMRQTEFAR